MIDIKPVLFFIYGGLVDAMPVFATMFFILTFANMGFPGTLLLLANF